MKLNAKFPLYEIRSYDRIFIDYPYRLIATRYKTYVLDIVDSDLSFTERRLKLKTMDSGYTIYALNKRYSALAQVLNSKSKTYVDADGKLIKLDRDKYHRTTVHKVLGYDVTHSGSYLMYTKRDSFVTTQLSNYVVTIRFDGTDILVQQVNDPKDARKGYKI